MAITSLKVVMKLIKVLLNLNDYNQLAYEDFKLCLDESLAGHQDYLFNYYHEQAGLKDLLEALKSRLIADDIYVNSDQIVITQEANRPSTSFHRWILVMVATKFS